MANSSVVSSTLPSRDYHCKICDLYLDTADSLEVHLQYHKENLYVKWGTQGRENETDHSKVIYETTVSAPADSSDNMMAKSNSEYQRASPETTTQFAHPSTPQSYHSAPSPYQTQEQADYSQNAQFANNYSQSEFSQNQHAEQINWEQMQYRQEYHKSARYYPYNIPDRGNHVSSSSPLYQPLGQPTPSPSPNQCDKCGFVCESPVQLNEHRTSAHPDSGTANSPVHSQQQYSGEQHSDTNYSNGSLKVKDEEETSASDILDLDSHKVVYQEGEQSNGDMNDKPESMNSWESQKHYSFQMNDNTLLMRLNKEHEQRMYEQNHLQNQNQKFLYSDTKFIDSHEQKLFSQVNQRNYPVMQMSQNTENSGLTASNPDIKPSYRPYDSVAPQITSTQPVNPISSTLPPPAEGKGANWKSNEARRPKTYNCTACNKWFTSSGHLKRHYNTTLHKNAVRSSGQPDPATLPVSSHHHRPRESQPPRVQQQSFDSNQHQPPASEDSRSNEETAQQPAYSTHSFDQSRTSIQQPYQHLQQGNLVNHLGNNNVSSQPLQYHIGLHNNNTGNNQPVVTIGPNGNGSRGIIITSSENHPNGEAGPSAHQNHQMRDLLVSNNNISTPPPTQSTQALTAHTLPPFSQLGVSPYHSVPTGPIVASVPTFSHAPLYLGQNFQETIAPSYPNGMSPHVMDMAINNLPMASPATFGEYTSEEVKVKEETPGEPTGGRLPSFAQIQTPSFSVYVSNYINQPNVGGQFIADENTAGYVIVDPVNTVQYENNDEQDMNYDYNSQYSNQSPKEDVDNFSPEIVKVFPYGFAVGGSTIKYKSDNQWINNNKIEILKIEDVTDYANKENYRNMLKSPSSPESAKTENEMAVTSTVSTPLIERNQSKKPAMTNVHKCYECDKVFNKACYLTQHNKTFHSGEKPFKCDRCGKRFADDVSYEGHCQKHTDNKPFKCSECPKSFNHKTDLRRHMCLHTGSKPFACDHCGKGFIRKDHMVKHYEIHLKKNASRVRIS